MLPNWLYGKSKSKLAELLGGGGGTPSDYNKVKAQVTQNTEDIASLDDTLDTKAALTQISNPNLLDNPWFTVNQRGQSSYTTEWAYTVDRWKIGYGDVICNVTNNGITLSSSILGSNFVQYIEEDFYNKFIAGKDITLSVLLSDGTIKSATGHASANTSSYQNAVQVYISNTCTAAVVGKTGENEQLQIRFAEANSEPVSIRAFKLELGSVSTLAMDTAPNYAEELLKCQRYFYRLKSIGDNDWIAFGKAWSSTLVNIIMPIPNMRSLPIASVSDMTKLFVAKGSSTLDPHRISLISTGYYKEFSSSIVLKLTLSDSTATDGDDYILKADGPVNIDFDAEL